MSRSFGEYIGGYFHQKITNAADDAEKGRDVLTHKVGAMLRVLSEIAYEISASEDSDCDPSRPINTTIEKLESLNRALKDIEDYVTPFREVSRTAVDSLLLDLDKNPSVYLTSDNPKLRRVAEELTKAKKKEESDEAPQD